MDRKDVDDDQETQYTDVNAFSKSRKAFPDTEGDNRVVEVVHYLEGGILNSMQPLPSNSEVKLSFDRNKADMALLYGEVSYDDDSPAPTELDGKVLELEDPYLIVEYVTSPYLRNFHSQIVDRPITMMYDDCNIYMKSLATGSTMIRADNLMGGLAPDYLFAGFVATDALNGSFELSPTCFPSIKIGSSNITMNGMSVQGFPISSELYLPVQLLCKFNETTGRIKKTMAASAIGMNRFFQTSCFISHKFEGEQTNEGWVGLEVKLQEATTKDYTLGKLVYVYILIINLLLSRVCNSDECHNDRSISQDTKKNYVGVYLLLYLNYFTFIL